MSSHGSKGKRRASTAADSSRKRCRDDTALYAISSSRVTEVVQLLNPNEETYEDEEVEVALTELELKTMATENDGSWYHKNDSGELLVYASKAAANSAAAEVWAELQEDHSFDREVDSSGGPIEESDSEEDVEDQAQYMQHTADGLAAWEREQHFEVDTVDSDLSLRVSSTITVEVVKVRVVR